MRLRVSIVAVGFACAATVGAADLKDMFNKAKEKAAEVIKKEANLPEPPAAPPDQEGGVVQATQSQPASAPQQAANAAGKQPTSKQEEVWPNLAVDETIVKQQQAQFGERCRKQYGDRPDIDCNCMTERYPQARLQVLSDDIRRMDQRQRLVCEGGLESCDAPDRRAFLWLMEAKTQKNYPTSAGRPTPVPRGDGTNTGIDSVFNLATMKLDVQCRNYGAIGADAEQRCLQNVQTGLIKLQPGTSTKAYCGCVKERITGQMSESDALFKCQQR